MQGLLAKYAKVLHLWKFEVLYVVIEVCPQEKAPYNFLVYTFRSSLSCLQRVILGFVKFTYLC